MYSLTSSLLLAQAANADATAQLRPIITDCWVLLYTIGIIFVVFILPFLLGRSLSKALKMPGHSGQIGLILASIIWKRRHPGIDAIAVRSGHQGRDQPDLRHGQKVRQSDQHRRIRTS